MVSLFAGRNSGFFHGFDKEDLINDFEKNIIKPTIQGFEPNIKFLSKYCERI
jgi:hypothetical protein